MKYLDPLLGSKCKLNNVKVLFSAKVKVATGTGTHLHVVKESTVKVLNISQTLS